MTTVDSAARPRVLERLRPGDLVELASDVGPVPMNVGLLLVLDEGARIASVEAALTSRLSNLRRLRQRLVNQSARGHPYWADDPTFDPGAHVSRMTCSEPDDLDALLAIAADAVTTPLPRTRPLWRAVVIAAGVDRAAGVVVVVHHVVTDGVGGLALLSEVLDRETPSIPGGVTPAAPHPAGPAADDEARRAVPGRRPRRRLLAVWSAGAELGLLGRGPRCAPRCSLNAPTGPRRRVATVDVPLDSVRAAAHRHGATVNDVLLVAAAGALGDLLAARGEHVPELVVSVPVSGRTATSATDLGNRVGVMPVRVPLHGTPVERLAQVARVTRSRKISARGSSGALVGPAFRLLVRVGLFRALIDRQRLVNTFVTNLRGPSTGMTLAGARVVRSVPITVTAGNVSVAFAALSTAGTLTVAVIVDPDLVPETPCLVSGLTHLLHELTAVAADDGCADADCTA